MDNNNPSREAVTRRRTWSTKGPYLVRFPCQFSNVQVDAIKREAAKAGLNLIDVVREGVNIRCGLKAPGSTTPYTVKP